MQSCFLAVDDEFACAATRLRLPDKCGGQIEDCHPSPLTSSTETLVSRTSRRRIDDLPTSVRRRACDISRQSDIYYEGEVLNIDVSR